MEKVWVSGTSRLWIRNMPGAPVRCPGCHYGVMERLVCEVIDELEIEDRTVAVCGVGCNWRFFMRLDTDGMNTAHGRAPDVATGIKRASRGKLMVYTVEGDGDCIAIGAESLINAAVRAERITIIMCNNAGYGSTGGQMAPTTVMGQVTTTSPQGRDRSMGYPAHVPELLTTMRGVAYAARGSLHNPVNFQRTKKYVKTAFQKQIDDVGLSFVDILSACPPNWHMTPKQSVEWIQEEMIVEYPLGVFKDVDTID